MANDSLRCDEKSFDGLNLCRLEFILPSISGPRLLEEFAINHNFSDQIEQESHPTAILDDSCILEVVSKPSILPEDSVEAFDLVCIGSPFYACIRSDIDASMKNCEAHGCLTSNGANVECESGVITSLLEGQNHVPHSPASSHP